MNRTVFFLSLLLTFGLSEWRTLPFQQSTAHESDRNHTESRDRMAPPKGNSITPLFNNLGNHHHRISTNDPLVQRYFDQGLILTYGFNHAEAIRAFREAARLDPKCAMCYWGVALALGPNINAPMDAAVVPETYQALQKALELAPNASKVEQAYIQALAKRYAPEPVKDRTRLDQAYADAMRQLSRRYPDDLDAATLFAEALMDLTPWNFWTKDGKPTTYTNEIVTTLESVLKRNPNHPGANHYYIHAVEASSTPERAIPSAQRLERLVPGAGHLVHMPAHIYWRVGRYHDAARINEHAIRADEAHILGGTRDQNAHSFYALAYYPHNIHFLFAAAQMEGRSELALEAARKLVTKIPDQAYRNIPVLEDFKPMPLFALVRFGKWQEILQELQPAPELQYATGIWHWARGLAFVRLSQLDKASAESQQLSKIAQTDAMQALTLASFPKASTLLTIASYILVGELTSTRGQTDDAITQFQEAVRIQDSLSYIEPPSWYYPVRHNLGAALLRVGRAQEAEAVYLEDLKQYPNNGWSLFGLARSLQDQGKTREAQAVQKRFKQAWKYADVTLSASRF